MPQHLTDDQRRRLAVTFDSIAELYDRARPGYAPGAITWLLPATAHRVLDLGAGTGKLTASLVAHGLDVVAVEPSDSMRDRLSARLPTVDARAGTAEATGLPDRDVDAVLIGAALHWFERPAADREIARVLRPGGVVGVLANRRDTSPAWAAALDDLLRTRLGRRPRSPRGAGQLNFDPDLFTASQQAEFPHTQVVDADGLVEMVATGSPARRRPHACPHPSGPRGQGYVRHCLPDRRRAQPAPLECPVMTAYRVPAS